jgi:hypothetical protein
LLNAPFSRHDEEAAFASLAEMYKCYQEHETAIGRYLDFLCDMSTFELEAYVREPQRAFSDMTKARNKGGNYVIDPRFVHFVGMPQGEALMRRLDRETKPGGPARSLSFNTAHMHPQPTDVARSMSAKIDKRYAEARRDMGEEALGHYVLTGQAMPCWVWNETLGCWEYVEPMSAIIGVGLMLQVGWLGPMTRKLEARENQACYTLMCLTTRALECQREHVQRTLAAGYTRLVDFAHTMYLGLRQPRILALKFSILYQIGDVEESMAIYKHAGVSRLLRRAARKRSAQARELRLSLADGVSSGDASHFLLKSAPLRKLQEFAALPQANRKAAALSWSQRVVGQRRWVYPTGPAFRKFHCGFDPTGYQPIVTEKNHGFFFLAVWCRVEKKQHQPSQVALDDALFHSWRLACIRVRFGDVQVPVAVNTAPSAVAKASFAARLKEIMAASMAAGAGGGGGGGAGGGVADD